MGHDSISKRIRIRDGAKSLPGLIQTVEQQQKLIDSQQQDLIMDGLCRNIHSRRYLDDRIEELALDRNQNSVTILMLDCDNFKAINTAKGHPGADEDLKEIATVLVSTTRHPGFAAKYGGDEFTVVLPEINGKERDEYMTRLSEKLKIQHFSVSIGWATCVRNEQGLDLKTAIATADKNLYSEKERRQNDTKKNSVK